ncbi:hypothetical protein ACQJBY_069142 [Aegilops geniculata]
MLPASKPLLALTSLTAMAIRLPPHAPTHYAPPHRRTLPFRSIARAAPSPSTTATTISLPPSPKKVLVPIAMGTEEMEAVILAGVLRRAGADVTLASVEDGLEVEASYGTRIIADKSIAACADQVFDLVALPIDAGLERSTEVNRVEWPFDHKPQVHTKRENFGSWKSGPGKATSGHLFCTTPNELKLHGDFLWII